MSDRFRNLDTYLPPARAADPHGTDPDDVAIPPAARRVRFRHLGRGLGLSIIGVLAAAGVGAAAARLAVTGTSTMTARFHPARGGGAVHEEPQRSARLSLRDLLNDPVRVASRRRPDRRDEPKRPVRRVRTVDAAAAAVPAEAAPEPRTRNSPASAERRRKKAERKDEKAAPAFAAPPATPLFDCYSPERNEHFTTNDRASAAQTESSKGGFDCTIMGYVYSYAAPGTRSVELDHGIAYVFAEKDAKTEPSCEKVALYSHSTGHDDWYSRSPADPGPVGYIKA